MNGSKASFVTTSAGLGSDEAGLGVHEELVDAMALAARLSHLPDIHMRAHRLCREIEALPPLDAAQLIEQLASAAALARDELRLAAQALYYAINRELLAYASCTNLYEIAKQQRLQACQDLLLSVVYVPDAAELQRQKDERKDLRNRGQVLTTGERKTLARCSSREGLARLLFDPHPQVVSILLDNPRLYEADVVKIAAADRTPSSTLIRIAGHPRWSRFTSVRLALLCNPHLPTNLGLRLVTLITLDEARQVQQAPHLSPPLALAVQRRLIDPLGQG